MSQGDLTFYVHLHLKPECVADWKQALNALAEQMAQEATFVSCSLHQDVLDENLFTLYERWRETSVEAFIQHQITEKPYRQTYEEKLLGWLSQPRTASVVRVLQTWESN